MKNYTEVLEEARAAIDAGKLEAVGFPTDADIRVEFCSEAVSEYLKDVMHDAVDAYGLDDDLSWEDYRGIHHDDWPDDDDAPLVQSIFHVKSSFTNYDFDFSECIVGEAERGGGLSWGYVVYDPKAKTFHYWMVFDATDELEV